MEINNPPRKHKNSHQNCQQNNHKKEETTNTNASNTRPRSTVVVNR